MGYDMYMENVHDARLREQEERYERLYEQVLQYRHDDRTAEAEAARQTWLNATRPTYFRLNIFGMGPFRDAMAALGMGEYTDRKWPSGQDDAAVEAFRSDTLHPVTGIRLDKFCSNDGWLVVPEEIRVALATHDALDGKVRDRVVQRHGIDPALWTAWLTFLRDSAEKAEGFRVW